MTPPRSGFAIGLVALLVAAAARGAAQPEASGPIAIAPLLDAAKGKEATDAFRKISSRYCTGQDPEEDGRPGPERTLGLGRSFELMELDRVEWTRACPPVEGAVQAIASGAFTAAGLDQVVLVVMNGRDRAEGDHSQGEYHGMCGFFGRGTFHEPGLPTSVRAEDPYLHDNGKYAARNELALRRVVQCGPSWAVELGKIEARGDRLVVRLVVETSVNELSGKESGFCERAVDERRRSFDIEYRLEKGGFVRATPVPRVVREGLEKN